MKITRDTMDELLSALIDLQDPITECEGALETWLDEESDREDRADARETIEMNVEGLADACENVASIIRPPARPKSKV